MKQEEGMNLGIKRNSIIGRIVRAVAWLAGCIAEAVFVVRFAAAHWADEVRAQREARRWRRRRARVHYIFTPGGVS
jgi:hypothetical protein